MLDLVRKYRYRALSGFYLVLVYAFGVFSNSAWSDDYAALLDPQGVGLHADRDARAAYGAAIDFLFSRFQTVDSLVFIRLIGLIGLVLLNDLLLRTFLKHRSSIEIAVVTSVAFTLPSFQFSAHWAIAFGMSWSAYFAVLGFCLFGKPKIQTKSIGFILVVISLLIYPLMSFFLISYVYAVWFIRRDQLKSLFMDLRLAIALIGGGLLASYLFAYLILAISNQSFSARVSIVSMIGIPEKLIFFLTRPFLLTYRPFLIDNRSTLGVFVTSVCFMMLLLLLLFWKHRNIRKVLTDFFLLNSFFVIALLPLLVVSQNQIDMRFVSSNTWLYFFVTSCLLLENLKSRNGRSIPLLKRSFSIYLVGLLLIGAFTLNNRFLTLYHDPFEIKREFLHSQFSSCTPSQIEQGILIVPRTIPWPQRPYIGAYSQTTDLESEWVPIGAVSLYMKEFGIETKSLPILGVAGDGNLSCLVILDSYPTK